MVQALKQVVLHVCDDARAPAEEYRISQLALFSEELIGPRCNADTVHASAVKLLFLPIRL